MISLNNIQFTQLDADSYCATASLALTAPIAAGTNAWTDKTSKRQNQRDGVRLLLQSLLDKLAIVDTLDELAFPYRLTRHGYYVCFSHSADKVAVAISYQQAVGIDVEVNTVAWKVAKRYYHASEIAILELLPIARRDYLVKLLWQVKESLIKIDQNKLAAGLGVPYTALARQLVENYDIADSSSIQLNHHHTTGHQLMILATQQTVIVFSRNCMVSRSL